MARKKYKTIARTCSVDGAIEDAKAEIEGLKEEICEWRDNMESNGMNQMPKYDEVSECADALEQIYDKLEEVDLSSLPDDATGAEVKYTDMAPYGRKGTPRWMRLANAESALSAAKDALEGFRDNANMEEVTCDCQETPDGEHDRGDHHEIDCPLHSEEEPEEIDWGMSIDALDEAIGETGGVSFPGMY